MKKLAAKTTVKEAFIINMYPYVSLTGHQYRIECSFRFIAISILHAFEHILKSFLF